MDPTLIIFGIRALIRPAREAISAFNQFERDRPALFPDGVSADFRQIDFQQLFDGLETQFDKVSGLHGGVFALDLLEDFKARTDRERLIIYCNGVKAWSLYGDVEGAPGTTFNAMAHRKKPMTDRLEADGVATDCRTIPATQSFDAS